MHALRRGARKLTVERAEQLRRRQQRHECFCAQRPLFVRAFDASFGILCCLEGAKCSTGSIVIAHSCVYSPMRRRELERRLVALGWRLLRHGARHDLWVRGEQSEAVPRHVEINERVAQGILSRAEQKD
jgi:mRNA interferase HicA